MMKSPAFLRAMLPEELSQALMQARLRLRGRRVNFSSGARIDADAEFEGPSSLDAGATVLGSRVGRWTHFGDHSLVTCSDVGAFCSISPRAVVGGGFHPAQNVTTSPLFYSTVRNPWGAPPGSRHREEKIPRTHIGNDVWIGHSAIVLPGVTVRDGAVIGAGAVVTRDVEPYAIAAGSPAEVIGWRFDAEDVNWLLRLEWWNWSDARLSKLRPQFSALASLRAAVGSATEPATSSRGSRTPIFSSGTST